MSRPRGIPGNGLSGQRFGGGRNAERMWLTPQARQIVDDRNTGGTHARRSGAMPKTPAAAPLIARFQRSNYEQ